MNLLLSMSLLALCAQSASGGLTSDSRGVLPQEKARWSETQVPSHYAVLAGQDTILYDDGNGFWYATAGTQWGVRFTANLPCTLQAILTMTFGSGEDCSLFVREDSAGYPGPVVRDTVYQGGAYPGWDRVSLSQPYFDSNSFWVTGRYPKPPYIIADSVGDQGRSYYTFDGRMWIPYSSGDLMIRAVVAYGETLTHDASITRALGLPKGVYVGTQYTDSVYYANLGSSVESFGVELLVSDSLGMVEFDTTAQIDSLPPRTTQMDLFPWTPASYGQAYSVAAISLLSGDTNPGNDTLRTVIYSYMEGEISFDDFSSEIWLNVDRDDNDKFSVRYVLADSPCYVTGARVFVSDTAGFQSLALCPDSAGLPDTVNPYVVVSGLSASAPASWVWASFDTSLSRVSEDTVWLVLVWPDSRSGPHVGSDRDYPVDMNSWAYSDSTGWVNWTESDFMMRIVTAPVTGIEESEVPRLSPRGSLRVCPNPFTRSARVSFTGRYRDWQGGPGRASLRVCDVAGRCVRVFGADEVRALLSGSPLLWDGTDCEGRELSPGVYFLVLGMEGRSGCSKAVLIR
jgi:hypothetical protein